MIPKKQQMVDEILESLRQGGSIGTDFLEGKQTVTIDIKCVEILVDRIFSRLKGQRKWNTPAVDKMRQWLKDKDIMEMEK